MKITDDELAEINKELLLCFGYEQGFQARYRLIWSTGVEEVRTGTYAKFDEHGNELATKTETVKVLKYPYDQNRYILERLFYFESKELPLAKTLGSYEGVYYFEDGKKIPLPVTKDACLAICRSLEAPKKHKTASEMEDERRKIEREQIWNDYLYLEELGRSALFYDNVGTFKDSTKIMSGSEYANSKAIPVTKKLYRWPK